MKAYELIGVDPPPGSKLKLPKKERWIVVDDHGKPIANEDGDLLIFDTVEEAMAFSGE